MLSATESGGWVGTLSEVHQDSGRKSTDWNLVAFGHAFAQSDLRDRQTIVPPESLPYVLLLNIQSRQQRARALPASTTNYETMSRRCLGRF